MRIFEALKIIFGDSLWVFAADGTVELLESWQIAKPTDFGAATDADKKKIAKLPDTGLVMDGGEVTEYCICTGDSTSRVFVRFEPASNVLFDGYFTRYAQTRGVSPLSTAINPVVDLSENFEWHDLRIKAAALFGFKFTRKPDEATAPDFSITDAQAEAIDALPVDSTPREIRVEPDSIMTFDLDAGEDVSTVESSTPNPQIVDYLMARVRVILLALDIPFTAFDSKGSSFAGMLADHSLYEKACEWKQNKNRDALMRYTSWAVNRWWNDNTFRLRDIAQRAGYTEAWQIVNECDWIPSGVPWMDKGKEIAGDAAAIAIGIESIPRACRRRGLDWKNIADENEEALAYYAALPNAQVYIGTPGQRTTDEATASIEQEPQQ